MSVLGEVLMAAMRGFVFAVLLSTMFQLGCGPGGSVTYPVTGSVTYREKIVPTGSVTFAPIGGGKLVVAAISAEGQYTLEAAAGEYEVAIAAIAEVDEGLAGFEQETHKPLLPEHYAFPARSGIVVTVDAVEANEIDLALR